MEARRGVNAAALKAEPARFSSRLSCASATRGEGTLAALARLPHLDCPLLRQVILDAS
jgi:hypothetical protein